MATWQDVRNVTGGLPEVVERASGQGTLEWRVGDKGVVWERPLHKADLEALGDAAPDGPILAGYVPHGVAKEALLADDPGVYFTTPHFDGYPIVLVRLEAVDPAELAELIVEAWIERAPRRLVKAYLAGET